MRRRQRSRRRWLLGRLRNANATTCVRRRAEPACRRSCAVTVTSPGRELATTATLSTATAATTSAIQPGYSCPAQRTVRRSKCGDHIIAAESTATTATRRRRWRVAAQCRIRARVRVRDAGNRCRKPSATTARRGQRSLRRRQQGRRRWLHAVLRGRARLQRGRLQLALRRRADPAERQEECDDGNPVSGDGCSSTCKVEKGYGCNLQQGTLPDKLEVPVTYRDFLSLPTTGLTRHPDFEIFHGSVITPGLVQDRRWQRR